MENSRTITIADSDGRNEPFEISVSHNGHTSEAIELDNMIMPIIRKALQPYINKRPVTYTVYHQNEIEPVEKKIIGLSKRAKSERPKYFIVYVESPDSRPVKDELIEQSKRLEQHENVYVVIRQHIDDLSLSDERCDNDGRRFQTSMCYIYKGKKYCCVSCLDEAMGVHLHVSSAALRT